VLYEYSKANQSVSETINNNEKDMQPSVVDKQQAPNPLPQERPWDTPLHVGQSF